MLKPYPSYKLPNQAYPNASPNPYLEAYPSPNQMLILEVGIKLYYEIIRWRVLYLLVYLLYIYISVNYISCFTAFSTSSKSSSSSSSKHSSGGHSSSKTNTIMVPKINITADKRLQLMKKNAAKKQEKRKSTK